MFFPLIILNIFVCILAILGIAGMFFVKNDKLKNMIMILMVVLCLIVGTLSFISFPSNYILKRVIAIIIAIVPLVLLPLLYNKKMNIIIYKLMLTLSTLVGIVYYMM